MKILVVADLHYALKQFDWVVEEAPHYDAVVIAGDLLDASAIATPQAQIVVIRAYLERLSALTRVIVCSGNHDLDVTRDGEKVAAWLADLGALEVCADGQSVVLGDTLFSALPWWDGPHAKAAIAAQLARDAERRTGRWIWAHHAPPAGSPLSWGGSRHYGDADLVDWIARYAPDIVCSGHVHHAPFVPGGAWVDRVGQTWCFNMGQQIGPVPAHIAVDPALGAAAWFSSQGGEQLSLGTTAPEPARLVAAPDWL